jgi:hypothetical protein
MGAYYGTGPGSLMPDPSLQGITKSFGVGQAYNYDSGNLARTGMLPELIFGGVSSLIGGFASAAGANSQAEAMIKAAQIQSQAQRDAAFTNLLAGQYALTGAKEFDRFQQQKAADYQLAFLEPRKIQLASEERQRGISDSLSPGAQKLRFQQNIDSMNRSLAERRAVTDAMFGPVAQQPFQYGSMPGYAQVA